MSADGSRPLVGTRVSISGGFWKDRSGRVHACDRSVGSADTTIVEIDPPEDVTPKGRKPKGPKRPELAVVPARYLHALRDPPA